MKKIRLNIDGREVQGIAGQTILEVARENDIFIPTLCYDERTEIYGSCGLCMVEIEGNPKILKSCATEIAPGMIIATNSEKVIESRKTNLELLLSNHKGDCRPPCVLACPAQTDCQGYVGLIANGRLNEALELIKGKVPLPGSIGRVCPHPCEEHCRRGLIEEPVSIAWLKRFAADMDQQGENPFMPHIEEDTGKAVAVIGGGPYGLSVAYFLRTMGHEVTIYEAMPHAGGMLRYGIPEYRLPKQVVDEEVALIEAMGVEIITDTKIGEDIDFEFIYNTYDAVALGIGAWVSTGTGAKGEDAEGVIGGIDMLRKVVRNEELNLGEKVAVIGGGNTAMDACRSAVRLGAKEVYNIYRRTKNEMPADHLEVEEAEEEGVIFKNLTNPIEIIKDKNGKVSKIKLQIMELGEPDASGRRAPVPVKGKTETIAVDSVILAIGQAVNPEGLEEMGIAFTKRKAISYDPDTFMTSIPGVFAGGDCGNDKISIAIEAIADARKSAGIINAYLDGEEVVYRPNYVVTRDDITERTFEDRERECRPEMDLLSPEERKDNFTEVVAGYDLDDAIAEASRCLECGCGDYFDCHLLEYANMYDVKPERFLGDVSVVDEDGEAAMPGATDDGHPFIVREEGKCILCGLCVRVCDQVMGNGAIGLVGRGFEAVVKPELKKPLEESNCVSCGQCVSVCPTGALQERLSIPKSVPLETIPVRTVCSHCSVGCEIDLETYGDMLVKARPAKDGIVNAGLLCGRGKFGFDCAELEDKIIEPYIKNSESGELEESEYYDAFMTTAKKVQSLNAKYGKGKVAISISDRYTNEEMYTITTLAGEMGAQVFSFNNRESATEKILGLPVSPNTMDELAAANYILTVGFDFDANPIASLKLRQAAKEGAKIVCIETADQPAKAHAYEAVSSANNLKLLAEIVAAVSAKSPESVKEIAGYKDLAKSIKEIKINKKAQKIADEYLAAKKAIIVYQQNTITEEAAELALEIALLSGHFGKPRDGVVRIAPKNNSQGLYDFGVTNTAIDMLEEEVKALLIFGEDPLGMIADAKDKKLNAPEIKAAKTLVAKAEFMMVCDTHPTETALAADVVIPGTGFASAEGTFTNTEGRQQFVARAVFEDECYLNWEVAKGIASVYESDVNWEDEGEISEEMCAEYPVYRYSDIGEAYMETIDPLMMRFYALPSGKLTSELPTSDNLTRMIDERLPR